MTAISRGAAHRTLLRRGATSALCVTLLCAFGGIAHAATNATEASESLAAAWPAAPPIAVTAPAMTTPLAAYRVIGAHHLYNAYGERIFKGRLPPRLYAIAIVETEIDEEGRVVNAVIAREPAAAKEVMPWILGLIRQASPFPKPGTPGHTTYRDIWLVDRDYTFQLDTLTEGQD